jgi:preprotein translocase subunit SecG
LILHIIICILLIIIVLFQAGKKFGLSGLMGGGSSDAIVTGAGGNSLIKKITTVFAVLFLLTSLSLTLMTAKNTNRSLMSDIMPPTPVMPDTNIPKDVQNNSVNNSTNSVK